MIDSLNTMANDINGKIPEFSVTDLSLAIRNTVESTFGQIRVKGEISRICKDMKISFNFLFPGLPKG